MNDTELDRRVSAADPARTLTLITLDDPLDDLLHEILAAPVRRSPGRDARPGRRGRRLVTVSAVGLAAAALMGIVAAGAIRRDDAPAPGAAPTTTTSATAAAPGAPELSFPPALTLDGWTITRYDERTNDGTVLGEMTLEPASSVPQDSTFGGPSSIATALTTAGVAHTGPAVDVTWTLDDRNASWGTTPATVENIELLGAPATLRHTDDEITVAIVTLPRGSVEIRVSGLDTASADEVLRELRVTDSTTFDAALPDSVVTPDERADVIGELAMGIPLASEIGFDDLTGLRVYSDRGQLAGLVVSRAVCFWSDRWFTARESEDGGAENQATTALSGATSWPAVLEIGGTSEFGYDEVIAELVADLPDQLTVGTGAGPMAGTRQSVAQAFGCTWQ